ncbi:MAG: radical SAM family heme chaperone HemW [Deltaproteobacteria bacterium]|nr:radical SAM family heme chaperone HemW [Deltaproteobacteria bacterium]
MNKTNFYTSTDYQNYNIDAGIYIHIPFCVQKCPYCDFYSITDLSFKCQFLNALLKEMEMVQNTANTFDTIYVGGGTPSILNGQEIAVIIETLHRLFKIHSNPEITIEVNPGTIDLKKFKQYKTAGANRINIGVQSFNDSNLIFLGRIHNKDDAKFVITQARKAGFYNIGLDLMYGLPDRTMDSWLMDLQTAIDFKPEHMSCYMLTYENDTDLWEKMKNKAFMPLPEKQVGEQFELTMDFLENNGYTQYEISNFAKSSSGNFQKNTSRHNQKYWSSTPYLGFGPSAHSYLEPKRFWNVRSVIKYISLLNKGKRPVDEEETLTAGQMMTEAVYLGLRKTDGIDIDAYNNKFNVMFANQFEEVIKALKNKEMIFMDGKRCGLTHKGMLFLDSIAPMFVDKIP